MYLYIANATLLGEYSETHKLWALRIQTVMRDAGEDGPLLDERLPWNHFKTKDGAFQIISGVTTEGGGVEILHKDGLSLPWPELAAGLKREDIIAKAMASWKGTLGSQDNAQDKSQEKDWLAAIHFTARDSPQVDEVTADASAKIAGLSRLAYPVPQVLGLSMFFQVPKEDKIAEKQLVFFPALKIDDEANLQEPTCERQPDNGEVWKIEWGKDRSVGMLLKIVRRSPFTSSTFLDVARVKNCQPLDTRAWEVELPWHFGKALRPLDWLVAIHGPDELQKRRPEGLRDVCENAIKLLYDRIHSIGRPPRGRDEGNASDPLAFRRVDRTTPARDYWMACVFRTLAESMAGEAQDDSGAASFSPATNERLKQVSTDAHATGRFLRQVAAMATNEDCLLSLAAFVDTRDDPAATRAVRQELEAAVRNSGKSLVWHVDDVWMNLVWDTAAEAFNVGLRDCCEGKADKDPMLPVRRALEAGTSKYLDLRASRNLFEIANSDLEREGTPNKLGSLLSVEARLGIAAEDPVSQALHPIRLLAPWIDEYEFKGIAVFGRVAKVNANGNDEDKPQWCCLTWGDHVHGNPEVILGKGPAVVPHSPDYANDLKLGYMDYRMQHLGVSRVADEGGETGIVPDEETESAETGGFRTRAPKEPVDGWGAVPALRYSSKLNYDFAFASVHQSGALAPGLCKPGKPCELKDLPGFPSPGATQILTSGYRRRATVTHLRPSLVKDKEERSYILPVPSKDIPYLADDILKKSSPDQPRPVENPPLLFLSKETEQVEFGLRMPAVNRHIWRSYQFGENAKIPQELVDAVTGVHHLCADLPGGVIDDPAVSAVHISVFRIFPSPAAGLPVMIVVPPATDPEWDGNKPVDMIAAYQRRLPRQIRIQRVPGLKTVAVNDDGKVIVVSVSDGVLAAVRIAPCIAAADVSRFEVYNEPANAIDAGASESAWPPQGSTVTALTYDDASYLRLDGAALNWRVETTPEDTRLPQQEDIWKSLKLERMRPGKVTDKEPGVGLVDGRLRVRIAPVPEEAAAVAMIDWFSWRTTIENWAWVAWVSVTVEKWIWNGLPQAACGPWEPDLPRDEGMFLLLQDSQKTGAEIQYPPAAIPRCEKAEARGYATRTGTAAEEPVQVNFAHLVTISEGEKTDPSPVVYEEPGDAEPWPSYYRVSATVVHRYAALDEFAGRGRLEGEHESPLGTPYQRLLLRSLPPASLAPPRVKIVLPLMDVETRVSKGISSSDGKAVPPVRPGFIMAARDTLYSPFHRLMATIEVTRQYRYDPVTGQPNEVKLMHELGPDGLTCKDPKLESVSAIYAEAEHVFNEQKNRVRVEGQPFGLTTEREAGSPSYPNAGFFFDLNQFIAALNLSDKKWLQRHDVQLRVSFYWEIDARSMLLTESQVQENGGVIRSPETAAWWVNVLATFEPVSDKGDKLKFRYWETKDHNSATVEFTDLPALNLPSGQPGHATTALLFVCWAEIPETSSPLVTDIFLVADPGVNFETKRELDVCIYHQSPPSAVTSGEFIAIRYSDPGPHPEKSGLLDKGMLAPGRMEDGFEILAKALFKGCFAGDNSVQPDPGENPASNKKPNEDAGGMLIRCSRSIACIP